MNFRLCYFNFFLIIQICSLITLSCNNEKINEKEVKIPVKDSLANKEQGNPYVTIDRSPADLSYFPSDYPLLKMNGSDTEKLIARVIYSRPQKKGREIFGTTEKSLCQYGKEWRLGANEATEIEFFEPVMIKGKNIAKGRYIIYCIPYPDRWTIILNNNLYTWGLHMETSKNIFNTDIPTALQSPVIEDFTMVFLKAPYGADLIVTWDNVKAILPITF